MKILVRRVSCAERQARGDWRFGGVRRAVALRIERVCCARMFLIG